MNPSGSPSVPSRFSLFWKVLLLVALVSLVPLGLAMVLSINAATSVTEELLQKNLQQMSRQAAERTSYTLVSVDSDLDVMRELTLSGAAFETFSHGQRRELYSVSDTGGRQREDIPKYREVAMYSPDKEPLVVVVDDRVVESPGPFSGPGGRWCETEDFVAKALTAPGQPVVSGLIGCHPEVETYAPAEGRLGQRFSGGIRVTKALLDPTGTVLGVATLVLSQIHLVWALESLQGNDFGSDIWPMMVDREGWVIAHPEPGYTRGLDHAGQVVAGQTLESNRSLRLPELEGEVGPGFAHLLDATNRGVSQNRVIQGLQESTWVAAAAPIAAEISQFGLDHPFGTVMVLYPRDKAMSVVSSLQGWLIILALITLVLVLVASVMLARNVTQPIRDLAVAVSAIARGETRPVPGHRGDEIGDLARAVNRMQLDLEVSRDAVLRAERLAAIGRFVSGIVHEVKNVLAGLGNYVTLLERRADEDIRNRILPPMRRALDQMDTLVVRLRELSLKPRFESTDMATVLKHAAELVENQALDRRIDLAIECPESLELPHADGSLLGQVFLNLLINAIEAADKDGRVLLRAVSLPHGIEVSIRDSGPGLPDVPIGELSQPFYTTKTGGTGLGLYICNNIVERHNGEFSLANHPDGGAVATVTLPRN
jgi:signal transduction histidine kinase